MQQGRSPNSPPNPPNYSPLPTCVQLLFGGFPHFLEQTFRLACPPNPSLLSPCSSVTVTSGLHTVHPESQRQACILALESCCLPFSRFCGVWLLSWRAVGSFSGKENISQLLREANGIREGGGVWFIAVENVDTERASHWTKITQQFEENPGLALSLSEGSFFSSSG